MRIVKTDSFLNALENVLSYIAQDKKSAAIKFNSDLNKKMKDLKDFPFMYHKSYYFEDEYIRDLIHKGYTIPYKVDTENKIISIIGIAKYKKSL